MTFYVVPQRRIEARASITYDPPDMTHCPSIHVPYWQWAGTWFGGTTYPAYLGPRFSYRYPSGGTEPQDLGWGNNAAATKDILSAEYIGGVRGSQLTKTPRLYFSGTGTTLDGQLLFSEPGSDWPTFDWWQWVHSHIDSNGIIRNLFSAQGGTTGDGGATGTGVYHCFYVTNYGQTSEWQSSTYCLTSRVSGWNAGNRAAGVWAISTTVSYLFFIRSGQVYFVKRDDNANTWSAQTQVTSGGNSITKLHIRPVGAGQTTKLYLITDDGGKVFVWDWSTESAVSSSFTIAAFPTHMPRDAPINVGSDYYHFHWVQETRTLYKWSYTTSTYANPTKTTLAVPTNPGNANETFLGFSIEFNTSTSELYLVAVWRDRNGWYPTGDHFWRMRYMEGTAGSSWSSVSLIGKRRVESDGGDPDWSTYAEFLAGSNPDGNPWAAASRGGPKNTAVLSAYSYGSNHADRRTLVATILETPYYTNPEEGELLRQDALWLDFWTDGVAFYVDAALTVDASSNVDVRMEGVTNADGQFSCVVNTVVTMNESFVSEYNFSTKYDIEGANNFVDGEIFINVPTVLTLNGSLISETWVAGEILINVTTTVTLDATSSPTVPLEMDFHVSWFTIGTTYHEEFLELVNDKRAEYGLPPYLIPTEAMYVKWTDVAQLHSDNMAATRTYAHEGGSLPVEWNTYLERYAVSGAEGMGENILARFPEGYLNWPIWDDDTAPSPQEAFDLWWNSPTHRENILRDWTSASIYSWFGLSLGQAPVSFGYNDVIFYLCNVFGRYGPEATVMAQKDGFFHVSYDSVGAMIENLNISYDLDTYANVRAAHSGIHALRVAKGHSVDYGARVAVAHEAPIYYGLTASHQMDYSGTVRVRSALESPYRITNLTPIQKSHTGGYAVRVAAANLAGYGSPPMVRQGHEASYSVPAPVRRAHECNYSVPVPVRGAHTQMYGVPEVVRATNAIIYGEPSPIRAKSEMPWSLLSSVRASHTCTYEMTQPVAAAFECEYDIRDVNFVHRDHRTFYSLSSSGAGIPVTNLVTLTVPGG